MPAIGLSVIAAAIIGTALWRPDPATSLAAPLRGIEKSEDAIKLALEITGLVGKEVVTAAARLETLSAADDVPFLRLAGRTVWRVKLEDVEIIVRGPAHGNEYELPWHREPEGKTYKNESINELDVLLDKATGKLVKIISPLPEDIDPATQASLAEQEEWMQDHRESYEDLADEPPSITFLEALQAAAEGLGGVPEARQIEAVCVSYRRVSSQASLAYGSPGPCHDAACPRWFVTLRYLPPIGIQRPGHVPAPFVHCRHEIDSSTGEWLSAGNVPW